MAGGNGVAAPSNQTLTITDDDGSAAVSIEDASANEGDSITFTVTLDKAVEGGLKVTPSFTDGTTTKGTDYTENTAALTFAGTAGETQDFTVSTTEDTVAEANETFTVGLAVSGTSASVTATDTATGTITDDEDTPTVSLALSKSSISEDGGKSTVTAELSAVSSEAVTVTVSAAPVSPATASDFSLSTNTKLTIATGSTTSTGTVTITAANNDAVAADKKVTVSATVSGGNGVAAPSNQTLTITDDDGSAAVSIEDASANEGDSITFTVTLDKAVEGGLKVTPSFTDVTATKGTDYTENTSALTFAGTAGEKKTFTVSTTEDTTVEANETFTVGLAVSGTSASVTATDTATGTITNDDGSAAVTVDDASANEGDSITFTVTLDKAVAGGLKVTPSFTDGTATKGTDYTENTSALTFAGTAGEKKTLTVATTEDTTVETNETFTVGLAVSGTSASVTATDTATGTITNDDSHPTVTIADASASEGNSITFTVTLDKAVSDGLNVTPSFTDGTATKGTDYTANTSAPHLRRHRRRNADLHRLHYRGRGRRSRRNLHRRPSCLRNASDCNCDRHRHRHHHQRRRGEARLQCHDRHRQ